MDGKCTVLSFLFWILIFSCIPFGWHKQFRTGPSIFLCFYKIFSLRNVTDTQKRPAFWGKQILSLSTSSRSSLSSFYWPCKMAVVICSWVLVMKWRIHSVAAWRSLCWSAGQVKLWQRSLHCTFPHCSARTVHTFSSAFPWMGSVDFCSLYPQKKMF